MAVNHELQFELVLGVVKVANDRCFMLMRIHSPYGDLKCQVLPLASVTIPSEASPSSQCPLLCLIVFRSKRWNAFLPFNSQQYYPETTHFKMLIKAALSAAQGSVACVSPTTWSKIEICHPGHWAYPGRGFRMTVTRDDMYVFSRLDVICANEDKVFDEQCEALSLHTGTLSHWVVRMWDKHNASLSARYPADTSGQEPR